MGDWPDYTRAVDIVAQTIETLGVDIEAQTLETLKVDIAAQTLAELNVNITSQTIATLAVDISAQTIDKLVVEVTGTASVSIDAQTVYLNIKHESHLEERQTVENKGDVADGDVTDNVWGKFFPHGMRGLVDGIYAFLSNATAADVDVTFGVAPWPNGPEIFEFTITAVAGDSRRQRWSWVQRRWSYDGMFIYVKSGLSADVTLAYDLGTPPDQYELDAGVWKRVAANDRRLWIGVRRSGGTKGDLPVSGTVSAIILPTSSVGSVRSLTTVGAGLTVSLLTIEGAGRNLIAYLKTDYNDMYFYIYVDGNPLMCFLADYFSPLALNDQLADSKNAGGIVLSRYDTAVNDFDIVINFRFEWMEKLEIQAKNIDTVDHLAGAAVNYVKLA